MKIKNILITGGAGYIGSHLIEMLSKKYFKLVILDNLSTGYKQLILKKTKFYREDIRNYNNVNKIIIKEEIDTVIHLAAKISLQEAQRKPKEYYDNNVNGTKNLLKAIKNTKVKNFIFSSTAAVYSGNNQICCKESLKPKPKGLYGKTKFIGEKIIKNFCKNEKKKLIILRYFNVVGASPSMKIGPIKDYGQLFKKLAKIALKHRPIVKVYGNKHNTYDGSCVRDFIDVNDLAYVHLLILKKIKNIKSGIIINCGYGRGISVLDVIYKFSKEINKKINIKIMKKRKNEISNIYADNLYLEKKLKWRPKYIDISKTIKNTIKWEKKIN